MQGEAGWDMPPWHWSLDSGVGLGPRIPHSGSFQPGALCFRAVGVSREKPSPEDTNERGEAGGGAFCLAPPCPLPGMAQPKAQMVGPHILAGQLITPSPACGPREVQSLVQGAQLAGLGPGPEPAQSKEQELLYADIGSVFGLKRPFRVTEPGRHGSGSKTPHQLPGLRAEQVKRR